MFFLHTPLTLFDPCNTLFLEFPRLPLLLRLTSLEGHVLLAGTGGDGEGDTEGAELGAAGPSPSGEFAMAARPEAAAAGLATGALVMRAHSFLFCVCISHDSGEYICIRIRTGVDVLHVVDNVDMNADVNTAACSCRHKLGREPQWQRPD